MVEFKMKSFALFTICVLLLFNTSFSQPCKYKLLLYATLEDSLILHKSDTSWLKNDICLLLRVDTINTEGIKKYSNKYCKKCFLFNGNVFFNSQLFDLNCYEDLMKMEIAHFSIATKYAFDPPFIPAHSNCLNEKQKVRFKLHWKNSRRYNEPCKVMFEDITVYDKNEKPIKLNVINCYIK